MTQKEYLLSMILDGQAAGMTYNTIIAYNDIYILDIIEETPQHIICRTSQAGRVLCIINAPTRKAACKTFADYCAGWA